MALTTNAAGISLIKAKEGIRLTAYQDITGTWTIGYGHTVGVSPGEVITQAEADQLLAQDLAMYEASVVSAANAPTSNQLSAMVSLCYNIGIGGFNGSTVLRKHNAGDFTGAANAFLLWDKAHVDGQLVVVPALETRRQDERMLYLTPDVVVKPSPPPVQTDGMVVQLTDSTGQRWSGTLFKIVPVMILALVGAAGAGLFTRPAESQKPQIVSATTPLVPSAITFKLVPGPLGPLAVPIKGKELR